MEIFTVTSPTSAPVPVLLSIPHAGTEVPQKIRSSFHSKFQQRIDDTDFYVDRLYDFAPEMGITMIKANYSRWVVDLNRPPKNESLYDDGRVITGIVPKTNFLGESIYRNGFPPEDTVERRIQKYYYPYHDQVAKLLEKFVMQYGAALLFDAHSIRQPVLTIHPQPFPAYILGDNEGKSAAPFIVDSAWSSLNRCSSDVAHNYLFKGGHITRHYGEPHKHIHALQLEMVKNNYMDDHQWEYHHQRAESTRACLRHLFEQLINTLLTHENITLSRSL